MKLVYLVLILIYLQDYIFMVNKKTGELYFNTFIDELLHFIEMGCIPILQNMRKTIHGNISRKIVIVKSIE